MKKVFCEIIEEKVYPFKEIVKEMKLEKARIKYFVKALTMDIIQIVLSSGIIYFFSTTKDIATILLISFAFLVIQLEIIIYFHKKEIKRLEYALKDATS